MLRNLMKRANYLVKKGYQNLTLDPVYEKCSLDEIIKLKESSMYVIGRKPETAEQILKSNPELASIILGMVGEGKDPLEFRGIEMYPFHTEISRAHCLLYTNGLETYLLDLNSKFGTFLNGKKIDTIVKLSVLDDIMIGLQSFKLAKMPDYSNRRALIIAVDDQLNLRGVRNDANGLETLLKARGFEQDIKKWIYDKKGTHEKLPAREAIVDELERLSKVQDDDSLTFIHYSGHGTKEGSFSLPSRNPMAYVYRYFRQMNPKEIHGIISEIPGFKILMVDSCHSGVIKRLFDRQPINKTLVICSAKPEQLAYEKKDFGEFTRKFLQKASRCSVINPSYIADQITMAHQDRTYCGDMIVF